MKAIKNEIELGCYLTLSVERICLLVQNYMIDCDHVSIKFKNGVSKEYQIDILKEDFSNQLIEILNKNNIKYVFLCSYRGKIKKFEITDVSFTSPCLKFEISDCMTISSYNELIMEIQNSVKINEFLRILTNPFSIIFLYTPLLLLNYFGIVPHSSFAIFYPFTIAFIFILMDSFNLPRRLIFVHNLKNDIDIYGNKINKNSNFLILIFASILLPLILSFCWDYIKDYFNLFPVKIPKT
jgi:hypothetical protein